MALEDLEMVTTRIWPTLADPLRGQYRIGIRVTISENAVILFDRTFDVKARKNEDPSDKAAEVLADAQVGVDAFIDEYNIYHHTKYLNDFMTTINGGLTIE